MLEVEKHDIGNKGSGATVAFFPHYMVELGKKSFLEDTRTSVEVASQLAAKVYRVSPLALILRSSSSENCFETSCQCQLS